MRGASCPSERDDKGYYRSKVTDGALYEIMVAKYSKYITVEYLTQWCHMYDTQLNEGMNRSVSKYVHKGTNFCGTNSLRNRVYIAAGVQLVGNHFYWTEVMRSLELTILLQTELYLLDLDKRKLRQFVRGHDFANMAKRKRKEHEKVREHLLLVKKDQERNATYASKTGCETEQGMPTKKRKVKENLCVHRTQGCDGIKDHKTNRSKHCKFFGVDRANIGA